MNKKFDVIIIGAGASGFACAGALNKSNKKIAIIDHAEKPLKKVLISGGGKCNFSNKNVSSKDYVSQNPKFMISALKQFTNKDFVTLLEKHKIKYFEKSEDQLFCEGGAKQIADMLMKEADKAKVFYNQKIENINKNKNFVVETNEHVFEAPNLVVATGGASYPQIGASETGYRIAKQFGMKIVPYRPALVPLNLDNEIMKEIIKLKGISVRAQVECGRFSTVENILFTHFGLSGPAVLQASLFWNKGEKIKINLLPEIDIYETFIKLKNSSKGKKISSILSLYFPDRIVNFVIGKDDRFITEASNKVLKEIADRINRWEVEPIGTQGFRMAEVTCGGVDVNEVSSKSFEANKVEGLFFVGEVLDVTGRLGGYNLQWAWSSGVAAGRFIGENR